jgi:hypothetical protein
MLDELSLILNIKRVRLSTDNQRIATARHSASLLSRNRSIFS